jgi:3-deoxy-D-manno-octulosonic-acid transferase
LNTFFYQIFIAVYLVGIKLASLVNGKAKKWIEGRKNQVIKTNSGPNNFKKNVIWMHCASLGEFEQGRPLVEKIKQQYVNTKLIITFFSPSGYEVQKDYELADEVYYLPIDTKKNAQQFIEAIQPTLVLWVKYDYWYYYLQTLKQQKIPLVLVSGIFRKSQPFFKWKSIFWKNLLQSFSHFFVQTDASKKLLQTIVDENKITIAGDTRFDRVKTIAENFEAINFIKQFCGNQKVVVAGSTWEEDEQELIHYVKLHPEVKFIIAPHQVDKENIDDVQQRFVQSILFSQLTNQNCGLQTTNCLIIDNVGLLSKLYHYADIAYIGGGFGADGVHNILEAAVYGKPIVFGPEFEKFNEAIELVDIGGATTVSNGLELEKVMDNLLNDEKANAQQGDCCKKYVYEKAGATNAIISYIQENRLLTN